MNENFIKKFLVAFASAQKSPFIIETKWEKYKTRNKFNKKNALHVDI